MTETVTLEALSGTVENVESEREDVQLWRASLGEIDAIGESRAAALRELAATIDRRTEVAALGNELRKHDF